MAYIGFDKLKAKIASEGGARNPGAVAAAIGRRKYGSGAMAHASALGRKKSHGAAASYLKGLSRGHSDSETREPKGREEKE